MNILLVGGTGFLGSYLKANLASGHRVDHTYANSGSPGGIRYRAGEDRLEELAGDAYDVVINNINPLSLTYTQTLSSTEDIVAYCKGTKAKLVQVSSVSALYENRFANSYNLKKAIAEDYVRTELAADRYAVLRFTQMFDAEGLSKASQAGLYYLLKEIRHERPISVFPNYKACFRNYMPVELAVRMLRIVIEEELSGVFNAHLDAFTMSFEQLLDCLIALNPGYKAAELIKVGEKEGLAYAIPEQSKELADRIGGDASLLPYFRNAYKAIS